MPGSAFLIGGLGAIVLAIVAATVALMPERQSEPSVSRALTAIDRSYTREAAARAGQGGDPFKLPDWLQRLSERLSPAGVATTMQRRLDVAGNPSGWTPDRMLAIKGLGLIAVAVLGALYGLHNPALLVVGAGLGAVIGFFLPDLLLYNSGQRRQQRIPSELPDALDMLTICVEAGLGFDAALAQVARNTKGAVADRTTVPELRSFVSALTQSAELGIPVAQVLREQSKEMRVRRRQRAEERAQKVPVKITFPLILCLFPALLVVILGPGIIEITHSLFGG
jgi:tight adherence protein C